MRLGVRLKLFLASFAVIAISVAVGDVYLAHSIDRYLTNDIAQDLSVRAQLVALEAAHQTIGPDDIAGWDALADHFGVAAGVRVTLIAADGRVLGDSEVETSKIAALENHGGREEVMAALSSGHGTSMRLSATVNERMMYVAMPFERAGHAGEAAGVARVAKPLRVVDDAIGAVHEIVFFAFAIALLFAMLLSSAAAQRMSAVVRSLTETARRMKSGDLEVRTHVSGTDELAELGNALDQLAGSLETTLAELRSERDMQRRILEGMHEGVLVLDAEARVATMNHALREMLLLPADAVGKLLLEVIRHAELHMLLEMARADGQSSGEVDLPGIKPRRLLVGATALHDEGDEGMIAVFVDVTDLRRLESLRRDFVANVSHELRTPVAAVRSAAETLRFSVTDPTASVRFIDMIERNAQRLQSLIEDLLELSRIESKEFRLKRERVDLSGVFNIVVGLFRERAERKQIRLETRMAEPVPNLETDQRALEQILTNLVENAVKYCPAGSSVTLSAEAKGELVRIAVTDTGPGISEKHLPRLFERFYRVDASRSRELGGTGLGLSIVKHLTEALGGKVSVDSQMGQGSTFTVVLRSSDWAAGNHAAAAPP
ncbi:MAG TPA: ATP-binding protein [Polyangiaceae bacterium]|nr:ATP-binding protein [Polyangiaceae bacterium]